MRAKINGMEVEGTPTELAELTVLLRKEQQEKVAQEVEAINDSLDQRAIFSAQAVTPVVSKAKQKPTSHYKKWTAEELRFLRENVGVLTYAGLGVELNRTKHSVIKKLKELRKEQPVARKRGAYNWSAQEVAYVKQHAGRLSVDEMGKSIGRSAHAVKLKLLKLGIRTAKARTRKKKWSRWTAEDDAFLREHAGKRTVKSIARELKRSGKAVYGRCASLGIAVKRQQSPKAEQPEQQQVKGLQRDTSRIRERLKFVHDRARRYCNQQGWSYEKAYAQAAEDWRNQRPLGRVKAKKVGAEAVTVLDKEFPVLPPLTAEGSRMFADVLRQNLLGNGHPVGYFDVKDWLPLEGGADWTGLQWVRLLTSFLRNVQQVQEYFLVKGRFVVVKTKRGFDTIEYRGEKQ